MKNKKKSESYGIIIAKDDDKEKLFSSQSFPQERKLHHTDTYRQLVWFINLFMTVQCRHFATL